MSWKKIQIIMAVMLFGATAYVTMTNDYMKERPVDVVVIDFQEGYRNYKYLIVENEQWGIFDIPVGPAVYATTEKGERCTFDLRELDIKQTRWKNVIYFFLQIMLWVASGMLFVGFISYKIWTLTQKIPKEAI